MKLALPVRRPRAACARWQRARGFTLLEMLIALALAGVMLTIAVLRIDSAARPSAQYELDRVRALVALGSEQAIVYGEDLGIGFTAYGYRFFRRAQSGWSALHEPRAYRPYRFAPEVSLQLRVEDAAVALAAAVQAPQVVLWASGELTPFEVIVSSAGQTRRLAALADGVLSLSPAASVPAAD